MTSPTNTMSGTSRESVISTETHEQFNFTVSAVVGDGSPRSTVKAKLPAILVTINSGNQYT